MDRELGSQRQENGFTSQFRESIQTSFSSGQIIVTYKVYMYSYCVATHTLEISKFKGNRLKKKKSTELEIENRCDVYEQ